MKALYVAASGMNAQQTRIDTVANNLANTQTTGFKKSRSAFQDVFYQELSGSGTVRSDAGGGVQLAGLEKDHAAGTMTQTGDQLHVAIGGPGLLVLEDHAGNEVYTRDGQLTLDGEGQLVNMAGLRVSGDIVVPEDVQQVVIDTDGTVSGIFADDPDPVVLGQLELVEFVNPRGLEALGGNLFGATQTSGDPIYGVGGETSTVMQGNLEGSNVDAAEELIELIMAQRAYELNSKVVQAADETMQIAANLRR